MDEMQPWVSGFYRRAATRSLRAQKISSFLVIPGFLLVSVLAVVERADIQQLPKTLATNDFSLIIQMGPVGDFLLDVIRPFPVRRLRASRLTALVLYAAS